MGKPVLIDFYADWCAPCKMQDPIMEELKKKFGDKVEFRKINVDDNIELSIKYEIRAVPTLVLEKDGVPLKRYIGVTRGQVLEADLNSTLK